MKKTRKHRYNKLVRDNIPEIIRLDGLEPKTRKAHKAEFVPYLLKKLREECTELTKAIKEKTGGWGITRAEDELIDLQQVIYTLGGALGLNQERLENLRKIKLGTRGGFAKRIILLQIRKRRNRRKK